MTRMVKHMPKQKSIALIAHDHLKDDLVMWCKKNHDELKKHFLCGTGTTSYLICEKAGLPVKSFQSGPLGGDQQIGAKIVDGEIDMVIFFSDPLEAQPHDPDIKALLRIATLYDIPFAINRATADFLMESLYMGQPYAHEVDDFEKIMAKRVEAIYSELEK